MFRKKQTSIKMEYRNSRRIDWRITAEKIASYVDAYDMSGQKHVEVKVKRDTLCHTYYRNEACVVIISLF